MASSIRSRSGWASLVALIALSHVGFAQTPTAETRGEVRGVVQKPVGSDIRTVAGIMITVHRVGSDSSGPLDSARSDATGHYTVNYRRFGEDEAVYFAAAVYNGIAYFSAPIRGPTVRGDEAIITVFDTTSKPHQISTQGHHLVVSGPRPDGNRNIVEVWELSNDTSVTLVGKDSLTPVWTASIASSATDFAPGQGDVGSASLVRRGDQIVLLAPFGPGVKQITYTYRLPPKAFPLQLVAPARTGVFEVLLEEQTATADGSTLKATSSATTQGRTFKRYLAQDVSAGGRINIRPPLTTAATRETVLKWLSLVVAIAMLGALVFAFRRRSARPVVVLPARDSEALAASIARLDADQESAGKRVDDVVYAAERVALKERLTQALAREAGNT